MKYTLDLLNNTLFSGNYVATNNGLNPVAAAFDSTNGYVYVANKGSNNVSVINGASNAVTGTITVGSYPDAAAFGSTNGCVYVANYNSGTLSIISLVKYTVTFTETGLPSGTAWYVNLTNGQTFSSTTSTISFSEPNGTYSYNISNVSRYSASPSSGSISVNGNGVSKTVTFTAIKKSTPPSGISNTELYGIIGGIVSVAVIGSMLAIMRKKR